jgi:transposase InsO family protein
MCVKGAKAERTVVPECLRAFVLQMHHNAELAAHQGHKRVIDQISSYFFWPGMAQDAYRWVRSCSGCKKRKTPRPMRQGITEPVFATFPNQTVAIDIVGPLMETSAGNQWLLTMIDIFTRWPVAIPIPNRKSKVVAKAIFENWICQEGVPLKIVSDQGRELISEGIKSICARMGISKVQTSGYNPTGNANIERFHRYLLGAVSILFDRTTIDWDEFVQPVLFAYRVSLNDTTGFSPFYLKTGRHPTLPLQAMMSRADQVPPATGPEWSRRISERLAQAFEQAREAQRKSAEANQARDKRQRWDPEFCEGDDLYLWERSAEESRLRQDIAYAVGRPGGSLPSKFVNKWTGPYKFLRMNGARYAWILKGGVEVRHNVNRLWKHHRWDDLHSDTMTALMKPRVKEPSATASSATSTAELPTAKPTDEFKIGELIAFPKEVGDDDSLPFGIGKIIDIQGDEFEFQWLANQNCHPRGKFLPCWIDNADGKYYMRAKPTDKAHFPLTNRHFTTSVTKVDIIIHGFRILNDNGHLTARAREAIQADEWVRAAYGRPTDDLFLVRKM